MSEKLVQITEERFNELLGLIGFQATELAKKIPITQYVNCDIKMFNGPTAPRDVAPKLRKAESQPTPTPPRKLPALRPEIIQIAAHIEEFWSRMDESTKAEPAEPFKVWKQALTTAYGDLALKLKGDTSLDNVRQAYVRLLYILFHMASRSEVFNG